MTTIELASATDSITFYPDPEVNGWVYDTAALDSWYNLAETDPKVNKRPNAHGAYGLGQVFTKEHRPVLKGQYYGADELDTLTQRERLSGLFNDGRPILMTVTDLKGPTSRTVWLVDLAAPWRFDFSHMPIDIDFIAPDARRYGPTVSSSDGMPSGSSGLLWDLGTSVSGLFWDWGTAGTLGQVSYTNTGAATTLPRIEVGGPGTIQTGFRITEIETGRELIIMRDLAFGEVVVLNSRTERATLSGSDITGDMTARQWFAIPKGATYRYQITPLGSVTGSPIISIYAAPAYL